MRISKGFFFQSLIWQKSPPQFVNDRDSKIGIGEESFIVKKRESSGKYILIGVCWHGEAGGGLTQNGVSYAID